MYPRVMMLGCTILWANRNTASRSVQVPRRRLCARRKGTGGPMARSAL